MRFFDAHCDTIGPLLENGADFLAQPADRAAAAARGAPAPHVTLPALKAGRMGVQVFASWVWSGKYKGREFEVGMEKVQGVIRLCADHPGDLFLASTAPDLAAPFAAEVGGTAGDPDGARGETKGTGSDDSAGGSTAADRIAVLPSLEGSDSLAGDVDNLFPFHDMGVRLLTLAWDDTPFCGSVYGDAPGLTKKGIDLVAACESLGVVVDVSHLSDRGFADLCEVAERPFVASHSNCRSLCPSPRNLTDEMIRELGERGGVVGITFAPGFLSGDYFAKEKAGAGTVFHSVRTGEMSFEEAQQIQIRAMAEVPLPSLATVVDHVKWAIDKGGEDSVGLGGDLDGVNFLPEGVAGVEDYPRIEESLRAAGLSQRQVEKVCYGNFARVFQEILG